MNSEETYKSQKKACMGKIGEDTGGPDVNKTMYENAFKITLNAVCRK